MLKVKANEKLQKIGTFAGTYRYIMAPELYTTLNQEKVIKEAALRSGISKGDNIFATQRGDGEWKDWCEFRGGKIEAGETPEEALKREIREKLSTEELFSRIFSSF